MTTTKHKLPDHVVAAMERVVDYLWRDELKHCDFSDASHIFHDVKDLAKFLTDIGASDYSADLRDAAEMKSEQEAA